VDVYLQKENQHIACCFVFISAVLRGLLLRNTKPRLFGAYRGSFHPILVNTIEAKGKLHNKETEK